MGGEKGGRGGGERRHFKLHSMQKCGNKAGKTEPQDVKTPLCKEFLQATLISYTFFKHTFVQAIHFKWIEQWGGYGVGGSRSRVKGHARCPSGLYI